MKQCASSLASPDDYIGKVVAQKYRIEQMIGEGGMGKVYRATQVALDKPVVLKVLRQALLSDERTVARFQREAKAASRLNHPNSISVIDFGQVEDGALFIAMEYVQGRDLHVILSREWPLSEARVIRIMSQVLSALADAHSVGVVHRDLKPENIMVEQRRGEPDFVKVLDFGIAKIIDGSDDEGPALTRAGFVCGTPEYMSPEQARGAKLDHRSDLYAVGVIIYQLMTGLLPFDSDSPVGFATKHLTEVPPTPSRRRPEVKIQVALERLIMRALAKNPSDRPQTAEEFRRELLAVERDKGRMPSGSGTSTRRMAPLPPPPEPPVEAPSRTVTPVEDQRTRIVGSPLPSSPWLGRQATILVDPLPTAPAPAPGPPPDSHPLVITAPTTAPRQFGSPSEGSRIIRVLGIVVLALAIGLFGAYVYVQFSQPKELYVPPAKAILPKDTPPLPELELTPSQRRPAEAQRFSAEGDAAWQRGEAEAARQAYLKSWQADTLPETALKLGELALQENRHLDAVAWWGRFRRDAPLSRANAYIDAKLPAP